MCALPQFQFTKRRGVWMVYVPQILNLATRVRCGISLTPCIFIPAEDLLPPRLPCSLCRKLAGFQGRCARGCTEEDWCYFRESNCGNPVASLDRDLIQIRVQMNSTKIQWRVSYRCFFFLVAGTERGGESLTICIW